MAKISSKGQSFVGGEISKLMKKGPSKGPLKGRKFGQKQAVAAALNVARKKGFKVPAPKDEGTSAFDALLQEKELTTLGREHIARKNFAIPKKAPEHGSYPIHDLSHIRNALARVSANGSPEEKAKVKRAVYSKYPTLKAQESMFDSLISEGSSIFDEFSGDLAQEDRFARTLALIDSLVEIKTERTK